eukprot:m.60713 g.60713  ORF g.60713 m.60713 type:complete len:109 (+) comp19213_c0_seq1:48-374(+)
MVVGPAPPPHQSSSVLRVVSCVCLLSMPQQTNFNKQQEWEEQLDIFAVIGDLKLGRVYGDGAPRLEGGHWVVITKRRKLAIRVIPFGFLLSFRFLGFAVRAWREPYII